jgi:putative membrane protein
MSKTEVAVAKPRSLFKGLVAGLIGGLVGTIAMTAAERMFPPQADDETEPVAKAAVGIRWGFGAAAGAAYGAVAEVCPAATAKEGASFGMAVEALTHEGVLPTLGLLVQPADETVRDRASEVTSHVVFGVATEVVRGFVRKRL